MNIIQLLARIVRPSNIEGIIKTVHTHGIVIVLSHWENRAPTPCPNIRLSQEAKLPTLPLSPPCPCAELGGEKYKLCKSVMYIRGFKLPVSDSASSSCRKFKLSIICMLYFAWHHLNYPDLFLKYFRCKPCNISYNVHTKVSASYHMFNIRGEIKCSFSTLYE